MITYRNLKRLIVLGTLLAQWGALSTCSVRKVEAQSPPDVAKYYAAHLMSTSAGNHVSGIMQMSRLSAVDYSK